MNWNIFSEIDIAPNQLNIPKTAVADDAAINNLLKMVFGIGAGVALIVIIIAGIQFILSRGEAEKNAKARRSIIYAAIGLAVCATAFSIVRFVVGKL